MIRDVDIESYLPHYLRGYKEISETLKAENPEFNLLWVRIDRLLSNLFIDTADEYGISRMEDLLGILPSKQDTLESRRSRVQSLWWNPTPYSIRAFVKKLSELCGEGNFEVDTSKLEEYLLNIVTHLNQYGQVDNLKRIVSGMVPENMRVEVMNEIVTLMCAAVVYSGTVMGQGTHQIIDNNLRENEEMYMMLQALVASSGEIYEICEGNFGRDATLDFEEEPLSVGTAIGSGTDCMIQEGGQRLQTLTIVGCMVGITISTAFSRVVSETQ